MARDRRIQRTTSIEANLTPMIDVTFLLVVFFARVSGITSRDQIAMQLARVMPGAAAKPDADARWVLQVVPAGGGKAEGYALNGVVYPADADGAEGVARALAEGYRANPRLEVHLRADRATEYRWVEPAMRAATTAARLAGGDALPRLNLVVEEERRAARDGA
jgi:biopolymer transport protein ExbD